jgi:hypothetical protein
MNDGNTGYPWSQGDPLLAADLNAAIAAASAGALPSGAARAIISDTSPPDPYPGLFWFDSANPQLYLWYSDPNSSQWVIATANAGGLSADAPVDGSLYGRSNAAWSAINQTSLGGPFLPLSGGTVSGQINGYIYDTHNQRTQALGAGGTMQTPLGIYSELSGVRTGGNPYLTCVNVLSDTADMGGAGLAGLAVIMNGGTPSGAMGGRSAIGAQINFTGAPGNKAASTGEQFLGVSAYCVASGSVGGVSGSGGPYGSLWGGLFNAQLESGATFWNQAMGCEINVGVAAGASAAYVTGAAIVLGTHNQAPQQFDQMLGFGMISRAGNVGLKNGIVFGGAGGWWPIDPSGSLMTTNVSLIAGGPAYTATYGIDLSGVTFSQAAFRSKGFAVSGAGQVNASPTSAVPAFAIGGNIIGVVPAGSAGGNIGFNYAGAGEVDYFNGYGSAVLNSLWYQISGGVATFLAQLDITGTFRTAIGLGVGGGSGPTWTTGSAAPAATAPVGSLYSRTGGAVGATLYVSRGGGTWAAVAGV